MRFLQVVSTGHRRKGVDKPPKGELRFRQMTAQPNAKLQPQTALETASYNLHIVANLRISFGQANPRGMIFFCEGTDSALPRPCPHSGLRPG